MGIRVSLFLIMWTKSTFIFLCYIIILQVAHGTPGINDADVKNNQCLTWNDNTTTLKLICKIPKSSTYVNFFHDNSNTKVSCTLTNGTFSCKDGNLTQLHDEHQVAVILHKSKVENNLTGDWFCQTKNTTLRTVIDLFQGIVIDSWVKIKGTIIFTEYGKRQLKIECSSCRRPLRQTAEVWINGQSNYSVWLNTTGVCILGRNTPCHPYRCNCSGSGNMFEILYDFPEIGTNISCAMLFKDSIRESIFHLAVGATFSGTDFVANTSVPFDTIKKPIIRPDHEKDFASTKTVPLYKTTDPIYDTGKEQDDNESQTQQYKDIEIYVVLTIVVIGLAIVILVIIIVCEALDKCENRQKKIKKSDIPETDLLTMLETQPGNRETDTTLMPDKEWPPT